MWGFRGPLGAFICAWGGVAMIASAPFDNWWHNAYGLDVKILSPPHILLALGMTGIRFGTVVLVLSEVNRATVSTARARTRPLFLFYFFLAMTSGFAGGYFPLLHARRKVLSRGYARRADLVCGRRRAPQTSVGGHHRDGNYTLMHLAFTWILQLIPAEPKLGPVYQKITHLVPPDSRCS